MTKQADKKAETKDVEGQKAAIGQIDRELTKEFVNVVRGLVIHQFAGWTIAGIGALMGFAVIGWWLYFQPWIERTVGGIPSGSVVAFLTECPKQLGWEPFEGVAGRVLIGAGFGTGLIRFPVD